MCVCVCVCKCVQGRIRRGRQGSHGYPCWDTKYKEREKEKKKEREKEREKLFSRAMDTTDHVFWMTGLPSLYMDFDQQNC